MSDLWRDPDLDRLVEELNQGRRSPPGPAGPGPAEPALEETGVPLPALAPPRLARVGEGEPFELLLAEVVRHGASDLLLLPGTPPVLRIDGRLNAADLPPVDEDEIRAMLAPFLGEHARHQLANEGAADFSLRVAGGSARGWRFRVNLHRQRGMLAAAVRALPRAVPTLQGLNLPASFARLVQPKRGLVLVCGPTGAGKTSTLAALLGEIDRSRPGHIITVEDPVEYEYPSGRSLVEQVEVGVDAPSFAAALRASLRQDPDVILVGEMRDLETVAIALTAAETGHLVLSTLHSTDVVQAIHRIVDVFPAGQQNQIRQQLALALHAVVCQQLLPRADGAGRIPAVELLLATYPVRHHIRNQSLQKIYNEITLGKSQGMISFEDSLNQLVRAGIVDLEEAKVRTTRPDELASLLRG